MNQRVYQTIKDKCAWQEPLEIEEIEQAKAAGAKGWYTRGYIPHFDKIGTIQMVTFRLADAMPASCRHEWESLLKIEDERNRLIQLEAYIDRGHGDCWLRNPRVAQAVEDVLLQFDGNRYRLAAWVIMPNHLHVLVEPWTVSLGCLLKAWKGTCAYAINQCIRRRGKIWQADYMDRYIRDEAHFRKARRYIESNPVKAHLTRFAEEWPFSSANPKWKWTGPDRYNGACLIKEKVS